MKFFLKIIERLLLFIFLILLFLFLLDKFFEEKYDSNTPQAGIIDKMIRNKLKMDNKRVGLTEFTVELLHEDIGEKKEGTKRILVVGDSFVYGSYNANLNTLYWKQLEYLLKKKGYNNVEIIGAGLSGMSTMDEITYILENKEYIEKVNPDLIIMSFVPNDLENYLPDTPLSLPYFNEEAFMKNEYNNIIFNFLKKYFSNLYNKIKDTILISHELDEEFHEKYGSTYGYLIPYRYKKSRSDEYLEIYEENAIKYLANYDIPLFVYNVDLALDEFKDFCMEKYPEYGISFYDTRDEMFNDTSYATEADVELEGDSHPNEYAHYKTAKYLLKILEENYSEYLGGKTSVQPFELVINDYIPYEINLERIDENTYEIDYVDSGLSYPVGVEYIKLNLKYHKNIKVIDIYGDNVENTRLFVNYYLNDMKFFEIEKTNGIYQDIDDVMSLNIHVDFKNNDGSKKIYLKIYE